MYSLLRHNFLWGLLLVIFLLGTLTIYLSFPNFKLADTAVTQDMPYPQMNMQQIRSREVQKYVEALIAKKIRLRNFFIRVNSQIYYSIFHKSFAEDSQVIIGKHQQLFELGYITSYCHLIENFHDDPKQLIAWADKLKILSDVFAKRGQTFIYLITPSKAEYIPQAIPQRFHCRNVGMSEHLKQLETLLRERNIAYVNGAALMMDATSHYKTSMFPRGGTHWNLLGAGIAANALLDAINRDGRVRVNLLHFNYELQMHPEGLDTDLLTLIKLLKPDLHYAVPKLTYDQRFIVHPPVKIAFIGGSFIEVLTHIFLANQTFSRMDYYFYFALYRTSYLKNQAPIVHSVDLLSPHVLDPVLAANVVVLEENSAVTLSHHGVTFYEVLMKQLKKHER